MLCHSSRNFDGGITMARRPSGDRNDEQLSTVLSLLDGHHNDHWTILGPFIAPFPGFVMPKIDVGENVSWFRDRP
jgi:hypothetical protein